MIFQQEKLQLINIKIDEVLTKMAEYEETYQGQIEKVHPKYKVSAKNLIHYLALRTFDNDIFQEELAELGFPISSSESESSILYNLLTFKTIICSLLNQELPNDDSLFLNAKQGQKLLKKNTDGLFGKLKSRRKTRILVTQPTIAAEEDTFAKSMLKAGMNCARVNCAHDDENTWGKIIQNIRKTELPCKVFMDLGGPKLRTGKMKPGHKVIHIKPQRNQLGQVTQPAKVWLAPFGMLPPDNKQADAVIPVNKKWLKKTKPGSYVIFKDSRNKKCKITIDEVDGLGRWGSCSDSAYVSTGMMLNVFLEKKAASEIHSVHELLPLEEVIFLYEGDLLRLDREETLGEPTKYDDDGNLIEFAHISCTLPEVFNDVKIGEPIFFDDGKIEGEIHEINSDHILVKITSTKKNGGKLKADKGINLPYSDLKVKGLTPKDKTDLKFISNHADGVLFSFVNSKQDVQDLLNEMHTLNSELSIILKIETQEAFRNLPSILLKAMQNYPVGVMIARGDLAIETGWKNFAIIQEEILKVCEAAHIPDIWATQVLENLAKKGIPTRAEITDAAMAQRAECVMLNKGYYIEKAVKMLDKILRRMQKIQKKKTSLMPKLEFNTEL